MNEVEEGISKITLTGTEGEAVVADPSKETVRGVHRERSEVATGQQKTAYTIDYRLQSHSRSATESKKHDRQR